MKLYEEKLNRELSQRLIHRIAAIRSINKGTGWRESYRIKEMNIGRINHLWANLKNPIHNLNNNLAQDLVTPIPHHLNHNLFPLLNRPSHLNHLNHLNHRNHLNHHHHCPLLNLEAISLNLHVPHSTHYQIKIYSIVEIKINWEGVTKIKNNTRERGIIPMKI